MKLDLTNETVIGVETVNWPEGDLITIRLYGEDKVMHEITATATLFYDIQMAIGLGVISSAEPDFELSELNGGNLIKAHKLFEKLENPPAPPNPQPPKEYA